jgi:hypothetical protein
MLNTILVCSALGGCLWAYLIGYKHGKAEVENAALKSMADSVQRGLKAKRSLADGDIAQRVRERFKRK